MSDPVPAIAEAAATGETAALFADIRAVLGVGVVNLIWRHLATLPGALPWAWGSVRPLYADGTIGAAATALHAEADMQVVPVFPAHVLTAAGLDGDALATIRRVLAAYDRTNAMALVGLSALLAPRDATAEPGSAPAPVPAPAPASEGASAGGPFAAIALPRLLNLEEMAPATAQLVLALNRIGSAEQAPILASMYRHLAHWPPYLALAWTAITPLVADLRLQAAIAATRARALRHGARVAVRLHPLPPPAPEAVAPMRSALTAFTGDVIAKMVVICALLRAATADGASRE